MNRRLMTMVEYFFTCIALPRIRLRFAADPFAIDPFSLARAVEHPFWAMAQFVLDCRFVQRRTLLWRQQKKIVPDVDGFTCALISGAYRVRGAKPVRK